MKCLDGNGYGVKLKYRSLAEVVFEPGGGVGIGWVRPKPWNAGSQLGDVRGALLVQMMRVQLSKVHGTR